MIYKRPPAHQIEYVSPFPPNGGWYDYETAATRRGRCPNEGNACFCTGACKAPLERQAWQREMERIRDAFRGAKPRYRVKAGREVVA